MENSLFQFLGDVKVGTVVGEAGVVDASFGKTVNQQEIQACGPQKEAATTPEIKAGLLHLNPNLNLIDMYIIIYGMWKTGLFVKEDGTSNARQEDVFKAFETLLGADFKNYKQSLSDWKSNKGDAKEATAILGKIRTAVKNYYTKDKE